MAASSPSLTTTTTDDNVLYSFVTKKSDRKVLELLQRTTTAEASAETEAKTKGKDDVTFKILKVSLTANNKFYLDFGDKSPFNFFKCYPIVPEESSLVSPAEDAASAPFEVNNSNYAHPCVWGIAQVTESRLEKVPIGTKYIAMLPIGESVSFRTANVDAHDDNLLVVDRPATNPAYNVFRKWGGDNVDSNDEDIYEDLGLACSPGVLTGFGLNFHLRTRGFYGADAVVITSASSKVALSLAVYLRHNNANDNDNNENNDHPAIQKKIIGYTSESNKEFCRKTGLYDEVIGYDETLVKSSGSSYVMVDIAGRGDIYTNNSKESDVNIVKLLVIGNASGTPDKQSTFSTFSMGATIKLVLTMVGAPAIVHYLFSWITTPVQELYLITNDMADLYEEWGSTKLRTMLLEYNSIFCKEASKWISIRTCDTEDSIQQVFEEILQGKVPPSETIILDVVKAVAHRRK